MECMIKSFCCVRMCVNCVFYFRKHTFKFHISQLFKSDIIFSFKVNLIIMKMSTICKLVAGVVLQSGVFAVLLQGDDLNQSSSGPVSIAVELVEVVKAKESTFLLGSGSEMKQYDQNKALGSLAKLLHLENESVKSGKALIVAAKNCDLIALMALLSKEFIEINYAGEDGSTALYLACHIGHAEVVRQLLEKKEIDVNKAGKKDTTPLYVACQNNHLDIVQMLLKHPKIRINQATDNGATPLYIACQQEHLDVVYVLLANRHIDVNKARDDGIAPLQFACDRGRAQIAQQLLIHPLINVNQQSKNGCTPLFMAAQGGHLLCVKSLCAQPDIIINKPAFQQRTAFAIANRNGHEEVKIILQQYGATYMPACKVM